MKHVNTSPAYIQAPITREYVENFYNLVTADAWTILAGAGEGVTTRGIGGGALITFDTDANDEAAVYTTSKLVPGTTNLVPFEVTGRVIQSATTGVDVFVGLSSAFGANMIADTPVVPSTGYYNGLMSLNGSALYYVSIHNAAATAAVLLTAQPVAGTAWSYRLNYQYNSVDSSLICTPEVDVAGGQNFKPVRASGSESPVHPAFYQSPNVYGAFPAAGLNYGIYAKATTTTTVVWDYAAWAIRRFN